MPKYKIISTAKSGGNEVEVEVGKRPHSSKLATLPLPISPGGPRRNNTQPLLSRDRVQSTAIIDTSEAPLIEDLAEEDNWELVTVDFHQQKSQSPALNAYINFGGVYVTGCFGLPIKSELEEFLACAPGQVGGNSSLSKKSGKKARKETIGSITTFMQEQKIASPLNFILEPLKMSGIEEGAQWVSCSDNIVCILDADEVYVTVAQGLPDTCVGRKATASSVSTRLVNQTTPIPNVRRAKHVSTGVCHCVCTTQENIMWSWGLNQPVPSLDILTAKDKKDDARRGSKRGSVNLLANRATSQLEVKGNGLLGLGKELRSAFPKGIRYGWSGKVLQVSCGRNMTALLTNEGLFTWGSNNDVIGREKDPTIPGPVEIEKEIKRISCGKSHVVAVDVDGDVWAWGDNSHMQCGPVGLNSKSLAHGMTFKEPTRIQHAKLKKVVDVACGDVHTVCLLEDGAMLAWGSNRFGQLGNGQFLQRDMVEGEPVKVIWNEYSKVVSIAAGSYGTACCTDTGEAYTWGFLMGAKFNCHAASPQLQKSLSQNGAFVRRVDIGLCHVACLEDTHHRRIFEDVIAMMKGQVFPQVDSVRSIFQGIPKESVKGIQDRALREVHALNTDTPLIELDKCYIKYKPAKGNAETVRMFIVKNHGNEMVPVRIKMDLREMAQSGAYLFEFEPNSFNVAKGASQLVKVKLICTKPAADEIVALFTVEAKSRREAKTSMHALIEVIPKKLAERYAFEKTQTRDAKMKILRSMTSYLPDKILNDLNTWGEVPVVPVVDQFEACILFIDVSGFTALNERLAKLGPAGPEQVSKHLNAYFGQLIEAVSACGGDVLKFAGDALICMFGSNTDVEPIFMTTLRAVQCALKIQTELARYDSNQGFVLTLHVGVGVGKVHSLYVGGVDGSWEFLVVGEPFLQLKSSVDASKTGEVVVSAEVWDIIKQRARGEPRGPDWLVNKVTDPIAPRPGDRPVCTLQMMGAMKCYIQKGVQMRLESHQSEYLAELRRVTVLFVKLDSISYVKGEPFDWKSVHKVLKFMQSVIARYGGMVRQFLVDDKGTVLIAAFGVPPLSHEDDTIRGLRTALEIHHVLKEKDVINSIGVTTGNVFCGSVGSDRRQEYAMVGDIVNLSARLMVAAGKSNVGILCDRVTFEGAQHKLEFTALTPIMVKGKSQPIDIFQPAVKDELKEHLAHMNEDDDSDKPLELSQQLALFGRDKEVAVLREKISSCMKQMKGSFVIIEGEAGTGKSFLLDHIGRILEDPGGDFCMFYPQVLRAKADAVEGNTPFYTWRILLIQLLYLDQTLGAEHEAYLNFKDNLRKDIGSDLMKFAPLLNDVLPVLRIQETNFTKRMTHKQRLYHVREVMMELVIKRSEQRPLFLIIDNLQWMDVMSVRLAIEIARSAPKVCILTATRPLCPPIPFELCNIANLMSAARVQLQNLSQAAIASVLKQSGGVNVLSDRIAQEVDKAKGNPRFALEMLRALVDGKYAVIRKDGTCVDAAGSDIASMPVPEVVQAMLMSQLDRLPTMHQMYLKVASVLGVVFEKETLRAIYPIEEGVGLVNSLTRALLKEGLIRKRRTSEGIRVHGVYSFETDIVQRVVYSRLLFGQRKQLHVKAAEFLQGKLNETPKKSKRDSIASSLARHWAAGLEGVADIDLSTAHTALHAMRRLFYMYLSTDDVPAASHIGSSMITIIDNCPSLDHGNSMKMVIEESLNWQKRTSVRSRVASAMLTPPS